MRFIVAIVLVVLVAMATWLTVRHDVPAPVQASETTIAILPFSNLGDSGDDYLQVALADELATLLSRSAHLAVRPFSQSRQFSGAGDLNQVAQKLRAELLITGHFRRRDGNFEIGVEVTDPAANNVVWRGNLVVPRNDSLSLNETLSGWVSTTLLPVLGIEPEPGPSIPANAEAYDLYLRSLELSEDRTNEDHQRAKRMLEQSLALDSGYAPAWDAFARRLYLDSQTANTGGERAFRRAEAAQQRALDIDPDLIEAATGLTNMRTERGELEEAYAAAKAKVKELPRHALTHFSLSYVLRFMGHLDSALRECEVAYGLDPQIRLRSCAVPYAIAGNYERAHDFLDLDAGSDWVASVRAAILVREGRVAEALATWRELPQEYSSVAFWTACLEQTGPERLEELSRREEENTQAAFDPEVKYWNGALQAYCGQHDAALRLLETAIGQNYCSYPAVDLDPLWDSVRDDPRFLRIREKAIACHQRYRLSS